MYLFGAVFSFIGLYYFIKPDALGKDIAMAVMTYQTTINKIKGE